MIPLIGGRCFAGCSGSFPGAFFTPSDQISFIHVEYANRWRVQRREQFLETTDVTIPWSRRIGLIDPFTYSGHRGRKPNALKTMLRMHLPRAWFSLSDGGVEDAVCDAHAKRRLMTLDFTIEQVSDVTRCGTPGTCWRRTIWTGSCWSYRERPSRSRARPCAGQYPRRHDHRRGVAGEERLRCPRPRDEPDEEGQPVPLRDEGPYRSRRRDRVHALCDRDHRQRPPPGPSRSPRAGRG